MGAWPGKEDGDGGVAGLGRQGWGRGRARKAGTGAWPGEEDRDGGVARRGRQGQGRVGKEDRGVAGQR